MRFSYEKKTVLLIATLALTALVVTLLLIYPTVRAIKDLRRQTYTLRQYLEKKQQRTERARLSLRQIRQFKTITTEYPPHLFRRGRELELITALEETAAAAKVQSKIEQSNLDAPNVTDAFITLAAAGSYPALLQYLTALEKLPLFLTVKQFRFAPLLDRASPDTITMFTLNLTLQFYVVE